MVSLAVLITWVLFSVVNKEVREMLETLCKRRGIPNLSILDSVVELFTNVLGVEQSLRSGAQHKLDTAYFKRMAAVEYAVVHDDGLNIERLDDADMLLVGVSRTSKTPTSMYLGHRGFKVANYALVPGIPFPIDKLPGKKISINFKLEYGARTIDMHKNSIKKNDSILIIDDLIATGGTAEASAKLVEKSKANVVAFIFVIDLYDLGGKDRLHNKGYKVESLIKFPGH